jgi:hypothetical protein
MRHLLRALLPMLALASLLVGGAPALRVDHGCDGVSVAAMEDCHKALGDHASTTPDDCTTLSCGQLPTVAGPIEARFRAPTLPVAEAMVVTSDADPASLSASPDLRPPIA